MASAFTVRYNQLSNKLTSPITIIGNNNQKDDVALWDTGAFRQNTLRIINLIFARRGGNIDHLID